MHAALPRRRVAAVGQAGARAAVGPRGTWVDTDCSRRAARAKRCLAPTELAPRPRLPAGPAPAAQALFYWWLQIALGVATAALVSTFVFPITAGAKVKVRPQCRALSCATPGQLAASGTPPHCPASWGQPGMPTSAFHPASRCSGLERVQPLPCPLPRRPRRPRRCGGWPASPPPPCAAWWG